MQGSGVQEGREDKTGESLLVIQFTSPVSCLFVCLLKGKSDFYTKEEMIFFVFGLSILYKYILYIYSYIYIYYFFVLSHFLGREESTILH